MKKLLFLALVLTGGTLMAQDKTVQELKTTAEKKVAEDTCT